jgi:hypothetical protein
LLPTSAKEIQSHSREKRQLELAKGGASMVVIKWVAGVVSYFRT